MFSMSVVALVVALVVAAVLIWVSLGKKHAVPSVCRVTATSTTYTIDPAQAANATTIAAVGKRLALPDHAVTIALATALQESQLKNLAYGDRDSVGLFQQRPSQGWGTAAQIMKPDYAAAAFFKALGRVHGWQTMSVTDAAQAVQHSDAPEAYASWEPLARSLAIAATGEVPAALACEFEVRRSPVPPPAFAPALKQQLGVAPLATPVAAARGWTVAAWLVGHAQQYRITSIRFGGREWTPAGAWRPARSNARGVQFTQARAGS
jgi:hypothetical protein